MLSRSTLSYLCVHQSFGQDAADATCVVARGPLRGQGTAAAEGDRRCLSTFHRWEGSMGIVRNIFESLGALALLLVVFLIATFPVTWLLMLFFGNVGAALSYWAVLPLGVVVSLLIGAGSSGGYKY
jgi:hypothetical protein